MMSVFILTICEIWGSQKLGLSMAVQLPCRRGCLRKREEERGQEKKKRAECGGDRWDMKFEIWQSDPKLTVPAILFHGYEAIQSGMRRQKIPGKASFWGNLACMTSVDKAKRNQADNTTSFLKVVSVNCFLYEQYDSSIFFIINSWIGCRPRCRSNLRYI